MLRADVVACREREAQRPTRKRRRNESSSYRRRKRRRRRKEKSLGSMLGANKMLTSWCDPPKPNQTKSFSWWHHDHEEQLLQEEESSTSVVHQLSQRDQGNGFLAESDLSNFVSVLLRLLSRSLSLSLISPSLSLSLSRAICCEQSSSIDLQLCAGDHMLIYSVSDKHCCALPCICPHPPPPTPPPPLCLSK